jgi:hypothetical protein
MRRLLFLAFLLYPLAAHADPCPPQTTPQFNTGGSVFGRIAAQWNEYFAAKVDVNNGTLCHPNIIDGIGVGITGLTGDVTAAGSGVVPSVISNGVVSYLKIQNVTGARLLGNPNGSSGSPTEIPLGTGLKFLAGALTLDNLSTLSAFKLPGTDGTCAVDDTTAVQAAINLAYANGPTSGGMAELYLGNGCYLLSGSGAEALLFQHPIHFWGPATFQIKDTTSNSTDIFHIKPAAIADIGPWLFENYTVMPKPLGGGGSGVGSAGHDVFSLDTSASTGLQLEQPTIRNITEITGQNGVTGGEFIRAVTAVGETNGQLFRGIFTDNHVYHCIDLSANVSDSQRIERNTIIAPTPGDTNCGINLQMIDGAGNGVIQRNNVSTNGGNVISGGLNIDVSFNEFENIFTSTNAHNTQLDLASSAEPFDALWAHNNQFQSVVGVIGKTTVQLTDITGIANGQSVTGTGIPGACTVATVSTLPQKWVYLSCYQNAQIVSGATLTIGGVGFSVRQTAGGPSGVNIGDATAIRNTATGAVLGPNRFGSTMGSPYITNVSPATGCLLMPGNLFLGTATVISDTGGGCVDLATLGQIATYTPVLTCTAGTLTTAAAQGSYSRLSANMLLTLAVTVTDKGSCTGSIFATLPATIASGADVTLLAGRDVTTSKAVNGLLASGGSNLVGILYYDGNTIAVNGTNVSLSGELRTSP